MRYTYPNANIVFILAVNKYVKSYNTYLLLRKIQI